MNRIDLKKHNKKNERADQDLITRKADLRRTQEKLERLKENFARAFQACPAALAITSMADGKFLEINMAYIQIMGYEPQETLGRTTAEMNIYVNPRERKLLMQQLQDQGCVRDYELQVRNKSGDIRTLLVSMEPIAYGIEPTLIWAFVDLTEKNQVAAELRKSRERMAFALETSGIGTWELDLIDRTAQHRSLLHDRIFGYDALLSEWTYDIFLEHVHPEDRSLVDDAFKNAVDAGRDWRFECRIYRADGRLRWIWAAGRHSVDESGVIRKISGIVQDITEYKQTEVLLKQKTTELEDINTALNVMLKKREQDNQMLEETLRQKMASSYESLILPLLSNFRNSVSGKNQLIMMDMLEKNLADVFSSFAHKLSDPLMNLTPAEIQIAAMIKQGMTNKQIAQTLHNSVRTIDVHRASIRRKLQIKNKKINLRAYLLNL